MVAELRSRGARVIALSRRPEARAGAGVETRRFDPNGDPNPAAFAGADAVIHLAGESIGGRWTAAKKRRIADSRIAGTRTLVTSLEALNQRPATLVSASAVGYYGDRRWDELLETAPPGSDFLAQVCAGWEEAARGCEALGVRTVRLRSAIALGDGGALAEMERPFKLGLGGPMGSGKQYLPWIHVRDLAALYCFSVENATVSGAVNAVTPDYATNARFARALGKALSRPALLPAPAFALRAILGEFADTLLFSQLAIPQAAQRAGFSWSFPNLEAALYAITHGAER